MSSSISSFELRLIEAVLSQQCPSIKVSSDALKGLLVIERSHTTAGGYIKFSEENQTFLPTHESRELGFNGAIRLPNLQFGLGAIVTMHQGKFLHIELFTYDPDRWNGDTEHAEIIPE